MAVVFAVRGNSFDAYYSNGGKTGIVPNGLMTVTADGTSLSGSVYVASANNSVKPVYWPGVNNTPNGRAMSLLLRVKPGYSGSPSAARPLSPFLTGNSGRIGRIELSHNTAGNVVATATNEAGTLCLNASNFGAWSPTSTSWYDVVFAWDGTNSASAAKVYIDATLLGSVTPSAALSSSWSTNYWTDISLGNGTQQINFNGASIDEIVIWDSVIDPTNVALVSGNGSLNGASRTSLVNVSNLDGSVYSNPGASNVKSAIGYTFAGVSITGTLLSTDPGASNVASGVSYVINSTTITGTLVGIAPGSGAAGTVDLNDILERIQTVLESANTTTATPIDLSSGMTTRVKRVLKVNPNTIKQQASLFPLVTAYITAKEIESEDIAARQMNAKREGNVKLDIVGIVWNDNFSSIDEDPADKEIHLLMENIELALRSYIPSSFGSSIKWSIPESVEYYDRMLDERTHLRAGILKLNAKLFY